MCSRQRLSKLERKKEIINAASKIIVEKGFDNTTMEEIIKNTTLSKGGVYHYYKNVVDILKDIMILGIDYRDEIIKNQLYTCKNGNTKEFIAKQLAEKILDDNQYTPIYVEFLKVQKRHPELKELMKELKIKTREKLKKTLKDMPDNILNDDFFTDFINSLILGVNCLESRENFQNNREILEKTILLLLK